MNPNDEKNYPQNNPQQMHGYPHQPQPGNFYPQQQPPPMYDGGINPATVITQQPTTTIIIQSPNFGPHSQNSTCPACRATAMTSVKYVPATRTHLFAGLICLVGCFAGCCLIPYCVDSCQNANHSCPNCGAFLGSHIRFRDFNLFWW